MALTGTYSRTLDNKRRLAVPKRLREEFSKDDLECLYVAPGTDQSLALYSPLAFETLATKLAGITSNRAEVRNYLRLFYARAEKVDLDNQGRIRIPDRLASLAKLDRDVVLLGVHDHAEIWDVTLWDSFLNQHTSHFDEMSDRALDS